jgi:hypothetical protein
MEAPEDTQLRIILVGNLSVTVAFKPAYSAQLSQKSANDPKSVHFDPHYKNSFP